MLAGGHLDVTHCRFDSVAQQPEQSHPRVEVNSSQANGMKAPQVEPAHGAEHAAGGGGGGRGVGSGEGGGGGCASASARQHPVQSHPGTCWSMVHVVCMKS